MKWLINSSGAGILTSIDESALAELTSLASYRGHQFFKAPGDEVVGTFNCFSWMGCFSLASASKEQLDKDYNR